MFNKTFFFFAIFILHSCIDLSDNKNEIVKRSSDYKGIKNSILFIKSGGATVGDSYQISILSYQDKLKDSDIGNIFIADDHDSAISSDTSRVNFVWISFDTLKVSFDKRLRVFKMETKMKDATIVYDSLNLTK
ncbi:MAG: hypothetical protein K2X48_04890 [Chitinophagaceae bacterium]|nr:hypothetical protein [Chitinophagaceae bacterium]